MSKTLGSILQIGIGIAALAAGPGGIINGLAEIGIKGQIGQVLGNTIFGSAVLAGLQGAQSLFGPSLPKSPQVETSMKLPRPWRAQDAFWFQSDSDSPIY